MEIKTKSTGKNDEISINREAKARKVAFAEAHKLNRTYLLVIDKRPAGLGSSTGQTRYFVRQPYTGGTNRMSAMTEVDGLAGVKRAMKL